MVIFWGGEIFEEKKGCDLFDQFYCCLIEVCRVLMMSIVYIDEFVYLNKECCKLKQVVFYIEENVLILC